MSPVKKVQSKTRTGIPSGQSGGSRTRTHRAYMLKQARKRNPGTRGVRSIKGY